MILGFCAILLCVAVRVVQHVRGLSSDYALALMSSPGTLTIPFVLLLPGTGVAGMFLTLHAENLFVKALGAAVCVLCVLTPLLTHRLIVRKIPGKVLYVKDPFLHPEDSYAQEHLLASAEAEALFAAPAMRGWRRRLYIFVFGDLIALDRDEHAVFSRKYGAFCDKYRPGCANSRCWETANVVSISMLSAWQGASPMECTVRNGLMCLSLLLLALYFAARTPFSAPSSTLLSFAAAATTILSVVLSTIGNWQLDRAGYDHYMEAGHQLLLVSSVIVILKTVVELLALAYGHHIKRRARVRNLCRADPIALEEWRWDTTDNGTAASPDSPISPATTTAKSHFDFAGAAPLLPPSALSAEDSSTPPDYLRRTRSAKKRGGSQRTLTGSWESTLNTLSFTANLQHGLLDNRDEV
ncbi:hypothetical protein DIPPA_35377 [Diplonema papillatum]|nr:hypothetical protein DIPPA_35377 [Diplonema papillatum]KAJ9444576.1 hypothetical protein DIPPA_35377 [Diplonema papillatum]